MEHVEPLLPGVFPAPSTPPPVMPTLRSCGFPAAPSAADTLMQTSKRFQNGVAAMQGVEVIGDPEMSVVAFKSSRRLVGICGHVGQQGEGDFQAGHGV
jgi:hypothetical protein